MTTDLETDLLFYASDRSHLHLPPATGSLDDYLESITYAASTSDALDLLITGVTLLNAFIQKNYTGPALAPLSTPEFDQQDILDHLVVDGERPYALVEGALYLLLARRILDTVKAPTQPWWKVRAAFVHQQLLDEPVSTLHDIIFDETTHQSCQELGYARWHLELAHFYAYYSQDKKAIECIKKAEVASGLLMQVSGALGRRTRFQTFDVSQLVVLAKSVESTSTPSIAPRTLDLNDDTLLEKVKFTDTNEEAGYTKRFYARPVIPQEQLDPELAQLDPGNQPVLALLDQCILLSYAGIIKISAASDDKIVYEQVSAYVSRVIDCGASNWTIHSNALLARTRIESHRSRTVERSVLQLQALVDQLVDETSGGSFMHSSDVESASALLRQRYLFALPASSKWELRRELAVRYTSIGLLRSALEVYQCLELWDSVALCHATMGEETKAETIIREQLALETSTIDRSKLWCLLGDFTQCEEYWSTAWSESNHKYARAQRSLGKYYFSKRLFEAALEAYELSLAINPLNHTSWFTAGCAALELSRFEKAAECFTRCIAIDQFDGEAWNNLASAHLKAGHTRDGYVALKASSRLSYENWRVWENLHLVALKVGDFDMVVQCLSRLLALRSSEAALDEEVIRILTDETLIGDYKGWRASFYELMMGVEVITAKYNLFIQKGRLLEWRNVDAMGMYLQAYRQATQRPMYDEGEFLEQTEWKW